MTNMLERLFPKQFDNIYRGYWLGFWLLAPVLLARLAMSVIHTTLANAPYARGGRVYLAFAASDRFLAGQRRQSWTRTYSTPVSGSF